MITGKIFDKMKKIVGDIIILHMCTKIHNIWGTVPDVDHDVWFLRNKAQCRKFFVIDGNFFRFDPPNNPKN